MRSYLVAAACLSFALAVIHSVMGEVLIFRKLRQYKADTSKHVAALGGRQVGILWATWHLASVLACSLGFLLWSLAATAPTSTSRQQLLAMALGYLASSVLVLVGTRCTHPGWVVLGLISFCTFMGR